MEMRVLKGREPRVSGDHADEYVCDRCGRGFRAVSVRLRSGRLVGQPLGDGGTLYEFEAQRVVCEPCAAEEEQGR